uniref:Uncharacterized protein n=1 Tax=Rhipicephalus microplus TaxID=6941 RepID=A0A6G5AGI1_RHIMP
MPNWTFFCTSCLTDIQANCCVIMYTVGSLCLLHTVVTGVSCCYFALLITAHLQKLAYLAAVLDKMQLASAIVFITLNSQAKLSFHIQLVAFISVHYKKSLIKHESVFFHIMLTTFISN